MVIKLANLIWYKNVAKLFLYVVKYYGKLSLYGKKCCIYVSLLFYYILSVLQHKRKFDGSE